MNDVICLAVGQTYELVVSTMITAHPNVAPYPRSDFEYLIPINKGGTLEYLYSVKKRISCMPNDVYKYEHSLSRKEYVSLIQYHEQRKDSFGYGKTDTEYVFYILGEPKMIAQPFERKGIQVAVKLDIENIPLVNKVKEDTNINNQNASMYVGITDTNWMKFIKEQKENIGRYINFWTPGTKTFKAIQPGELFLFKLHAKKAKGENGEIVGGAYFDGFEQMSVSEAWNRFGYGNGTTSQFELKSAIDEYRVRNNMDRSADIGCIVLRDPFFFEEDKWIESPVDWGKSIVSGKKYDISEGIGCELYQQVSAMMNDNVDEIIISDIESDADKLQILGKERETFIKARVNQSVFRERLLNKYDCCCLCKVSNPKFLIASHIKPWADSENDEKLDADNGFLLCPNHDALFDFGYISFDENGTIMISEELGQVDTIFMNVDKNMKISLSSGNKKYLEYHRNNIFKK